MDPQHHQGTSNRKIKETPTGKAATIEHHLFTSRERSPKRKAVRSADKQMLNIRLSATTKTAATANIAHIG